MSVPNTDLISIIIPVYNVKKYIRRNLDSVRNQTYKKLEVILVDDGSSDGTAEILDEYAALDERFKVIHKENGGSSSARNVGIEEATGEYIGFLDSDDWPEFDMYETLYQAIMGDGSVKVAQMMSRDYLEDGTMVKEGYKVDGSIYLLPREKYFRELMLHVGDSSFCTKLFHKSLIKKYRFKENQLNEDFELLLRMLPEMDGIITVAKVGYNITLTGNSNSRGVYKQAHYEATMKNADLALLLARESFPEVETEAIRFTLVQSMYFMLHVPVEQMNGKNALYLAEKNRIKSSKVQIKTNPYLEEDFRKKLLIFAYLPPKPIRALHGFYMKLRDR